MIDKNRAVQLLGAGLRAVDVATTLGCDPSYISQLLEDDETRGQVLAIRLQQLQASTARDKKIDEIEDELIEKLKQSVPWMTKARDILTAFNIVNAAKRRGVAAQNGDLHLGMTVVAISLPPAAKQFFFPKTNAQGEVVQVGEQVTVTKSLQQLMQERTLVQRKERAVDAVVTSETRGEAVAAGAAAAAVEKAAA